MTDFVITPANIDDCNGVWDLADSYDCVGAAMCLSGIAMLLVALLSRYICLSTEQLQYSVKKRKI